MHLFRIGPQLAITHLFFCFVSLFCLNRHGTPIINEGPNLPRREYPRPNSLRSKLLTIQRLLQRNRPHHPLQFKILPSLTEDTNNGNCQSACLATGYLLPGTADAFNCWCDNVMNLKSNKLLKSYCNGSLRRRRRNLQRILRRKRLQRVNDTYFSTPPNPDLGIGNPGPTRSLLWRLHYPAKFCRRVQANFG